MKMAVLQKQSDALTCDAAEQTQTRCTVTSLATRVTFRRARGHRDRHRDGLVELPPPGLHSDNGAEGGSVPEDGSGQLIWHRLSLNTNTRPPADTHKTAHLSVSKPNPGASSGRSRQKSLVYLQANADLLGERPLWERSLDHGHGAAGQHASIRTHVVRILLDP